VAKQQKKAQIKDEEFLRIIGERIRYFREARDLTQTELAIACKDNLDYSQISRMELGKVNFSITYLKVVADALNISTHDLLP